MKKLSELTDLFLLFVFFAVCGWVYEVLLTLWAYGYFENRGFLHGPWLPIYGFGGVALYLMLGRLCVIRKPFCKTLPVLAAVFLGICVAATVIELAASYILDAVGIGFDTLWDYYAEVPNFEGRIGLISSIRFGVIGTAALYLGVPLWQKFVSIKSRSAVNVTAAILFLLLLIDLLVRLLWQ